MDAHHIDDVDMNEEEQQMQDQDEPQDNNNQDIDGDEGDADQVEVNVDDIDEIRRLRFEHACERIKQNDPDYDNYRASIDLDDERAVLLGRALLGNTALEKLEVTFMEYPAFTSQGASAFVGGILGSQIKCLTLGGDEEPPLEMSQLCGPSLEKLFLRFPVMDEFAIRLGEFLKLSKSLETFYMLVDQLTPRGARALSDFLRSSHITTLKFTVYSWETAASVAMQTLYMEGIQHCQHIQNLDLLRIMGDMHALATVVPKLHELTIKEVVMSDSDVEILSHALKGANQLHTLSIWHCGLNNDHMSMLSSAIGNHPSIKSVSLNNKRIEDAGITSFVEHWSPESKIEKLVLTACGIGPKGAELLIKESSNHPALRSLNLAFNWSIGYAGLKLIGDALPNTKIQTLDLWSVINWAKYEDGDYDTAAVIQKDKNMAATALLEGVRGNGHLLQVRLSSGLHLPAAAVEEINLYVKANAVGRRAVLEQSHTLPSGVWSHFFAKKGMTSSLVFLFLQELPGVVMGGSRNSSIGRKRRRL